MKKSSAGSLIVGLFLSIIGTVSLNAQTTRVNSPYTLFGIGTLNNTNLNARSISMGGIKYGWQEASLVNPANPASYAAFDSTSFVFEAAISGSLANLKSNELSESTQSASLRYLTFGFPVTHWWKSSFGLLPFSSVGYNVTQDEMTDHFGLTRYTNDGSGGFNQVYWGNAIKITRNFSLGFNATYVFGTIDRGLTMSFPDSAGYFSTRVRNSVTASDFIFDYGAQYTQPLKKDMDVTFGLSFSNTTNLSAEKQNLVRSFYGSNNNVLYIRDTIVNESGVKGDIVIPLAVGGGFVFKKYDKWLAGADVSWQKWEEFRQFGVSDSLSNRLSFSLGAEYIPDKYSIFSYWERVSYRLGFKYSNSYLKLKGNQLKEFGISFGFGFPVWRSRSTLNVGFELGRWGTTKDDLIQENYFKFIFAVNIFENWFIKPKYR